MHKPGLEARFGPIEVDALKEDAIEMEVEIEGAAKALDTCDRPWLHLGPWEPTGERRVDARCRLIFLYSVASRSSALVKVTNLWSWALRRAAFSPVCCQ